MAGTKSNKPGGRFAALRELREHREELPEEDLPTTTLAPPTEPETTTEDRGGEGTTALVDTGPAATIVPAVAEKGRKTSPRPLKTAELDNGKRGPGRPPGRRSDPDYTQISAYIPLDLLLDVQEELNEEKRIQRKRTAISVSELVEDLLSDWLKKRKAKKSK